MIGHWSMFDGSQTRPSLLRSPPIQFQYQYPTIARDFDHPSNEKIPITNPNPSSDLHFLLPLIHRFLFKSINQLLPIRLAYSLLFSQRLFLFRWSIFCPVRVSLLVTRFIALLVWFNYFSFELRIRVNRCFIRFDFWYNEVTWSSVWVNSHLGFFLLPFLFVTGIDNSDL